MLFSFETLATSLDRSSVFKVFKVFNVFGYTGAVYLFTQNCLTAPGFLYQFIVENHNRLDVY